MPTYYEYHPAYKDWIGVSAEFSGYSTTTVATSSGAGQTTVWSGSSWSRVDDQRGVYYSTQTVSIGSSLIWSSPIEQPALSIATATAPPAISTSGYNLGWDGSNWTVTANHMIPEGDEVESLGSPTNKYKDVYVSEGTVYLGTHSLSVNLNDLKYDGENIAIKNGDNLNVTGVLTAQNISVGNSVSATNFYGNGASLEGVPTDLGSLSDVELTGLADGETLIFNQSTGNFEPGTPEADLPPNAVVDTLNIAGVTTFGENKEQFTQTFGGTTNGTPTFTQVDMSRLYRVESNLVVVQGTNDFTADTCYFFYDGNNIRAEKPDGTPVSLNTGPIPNPDIDVGGTYSILYDASPPFLSIRCDRNGGGPADPIAAKITVVGFLKPDPFVP